MVLDITRFYILILVLMTLTLILGRRVARKQKNSVPNILESSQSQDLLEFGLLLRFVGLMKVIIIVSYLIGIQGKEPFLGDFVKKNVVVGLCCNI